jgi:peptidoglycan hydrolase-like protein with peptidoglycan-binding domain
MASRTVHRAAAAVLVAAAAALAAPATPPAAAAPPPPTAEAGVLGLGARGPTVRALQRELRARGFRVAVDGAYGRGTRRAVARFQRRLGLRVNGLVDRPLLWWLGLSVCELPGPTTARGGSRGQLRLGSYGPRVCGLQRQLARSGEEIAVDGGYGPQTRAAVRRAQRRLGLPVTGVADDRLRARLRAARPPRAGPSAPPGTILAIGAEGPGVRRLQIALRRRGVAVAVDGAFGPRTRRAVARYQRRAGLPVNGAADIALLRRLKATRARHLVVFPVHGPHSFSNDFGAPRHQGRHEGNDIIALRGTPVVAVADGTIERMTRVEMGLGGIWIWLRDDAGTGYYYAHLRAIAPGLAPGSRVRAGQKLGEVGRTGDARGGVYHLHFEMHPAGRGAVNPYPELRDVDPATAGAV